MTDTTAFDRQLGDLVCVMTIALRAGYGLRQILEILSTEAPEPTASACKRWVADLEAGLSYDEAFANMQKAWPSQYLAQVIAAIQGHQQTGGNLADMLEPIGDGVFKEIGSDKAFYPAMRELANSVCAPLPERAREN